MDHILKNIKKLTNKIEYDAQLISREESLVSEIEKTRVEGVIIGIIIVFIFIGIPLLLLTR